MPKNFHLFSQIAEEQKGKIEHRTYFNRVNVHMYKCIAMSKNASLFVSVLVHVFQCNTRIQPLLSIHLLFKFFFVRILVELTVAPKGYEQYIAENIIQQLFSFKRRERVPLSFEPVNPREHITKRLLYFQVINRTLWIHLQLAIVVLDTAHVEGYQVI